MEALQREGRSINDAYATVSSGSVITIDAGATQSGTTLEPGGRAFVSGLGYGTLVDDGTEYPYGKAVTSGDVVGGPNADAGEVIVMGGVASSVTVELGGSLLLSGGSAVDATIQDGGGQVLLGGTSYNTDVGAGGSDDVQGGRASGTLVESGGVEDVDGSTAFGIGALVESGGLVSVTGAAPRTQRSAERRRRGRHSIRHCRRHDHLLSFVNFGALST